MLLLLMWHHFKCALETDSCVCVAYTFGIVSVSTLSLHAQQHTCKGGSYKGLAATLCCCKAVENFYNSQLSLEVLLLSTPYMPKKGYTISPVQYYHITSDSPLFSPLSFL